MTTSRLRAAILALPLSFVTLAAPGFAQEANTSTFPVRNFLDNNGVDLLAGVFTARTPEILVGNQDDGLSFQREVRAGVARDSLLGTITVSGNIYTVGIGASSEEFSGTSASGPFTSLEQRGSTLVRNSSSEYTYTDSNGTVAKFITPSGGYGIGAITEITYPSGKKLNFHYTETYIPFGSITLTLRRLQSVTSNTGYHIKFTYESEVYDSSSPNLWTHAIKVTAINDFVDACPTSSNDCTITQAWPKMTVSNLAATDRDYGDSLGNVTRYTFGGPNGEITGIRFPGSSANDVTIAYASGKVSSVTAAGVTTTYAYADVGNERTVTVTRGSAPSRVFKFDIALKQMKSAQDELGRITSYEYDTSARPTKVTHPEGNITSGGNYVTFAYDGRGNLTTATRVAKVGSGLSNIVTSAAYPPTCTNGITCNKPTSTTDARGKITNYTYDPNHGGLLTATAPAPTTGAVQPQVRYGYTRLDSTGAASATGVYELTSVSACQTTASCAGAADEVKATIGYGQNLLPTTVTTAAGNGAVTATVTHGYDPVGNLLTVDGPLPGSGDTIRYRYDSARRRVGTVSPDPDGGSALKPRAIRQTYNGRGQTTKVETGTVNSQSDADWAGMTVIETSDILYDANGRQVKQTLTAGGSVKVAVQQSYDALGRLDCVAQRMNPTVFGSLPASACTLGTTGSAGPDRISKTLYDAANRPIKVQAPYGVTGQQRDVVTSSYTPNGRLATVTDGEVNMTTYEYDGFDRLLKTRFPSTTKGAGTSSTTDYEQLTYDAGSNVISVRRRSNAVIGLGYDDLSRLTSKNSPGSEPDVTYAYDNLGRLTSAVQTGNSLSFTYDALGRNLTQSGPLGTNSFAYDAAGRRSQMIYAGTGLSLNYEYLVTGELTKIRENGVAGTALGTYAYDNQGRRTSLTRADGTSATYGYDALSRLSQLVENIGGTANDLTVDFTYTPASQIATAVRTNDIYAWPGYFNADRSSTINGLNQPTVTTSVGFAPVNFTYDGNGNLSQSGSTTYIYDSENRLLTANGTSCPTCSGTASFAYDPAGRLFQTVGSATTRLAYDGGNIIAEYDGSNALLRRYVHGPGADEPLVWYEGTGTATRKFFHSDERGSVIAVTDNSGNATVTNSYDEYGIPADTNSGRFQYTGQAWLPEIGMYYYKARIYSPTLGRFLQTDPIGYSAGMNMYAYVGGDPVNLRDPSGLCYVDLDEKECDPPPPDDQEIVVTGRRLAVPAVLLPYDGPYIGPPAGLDPVNGDIIVTGKRLGPQSEKACSSGYDAADFAADASDTSLALEGTAVVLGVGAIAASPTGVGGGILGLGALGAAAGSKVASVVSIGAYGYDFLNTGRTSSLIGAGTGVLSLLTSGIGTRLTSNVMRSGRKFGDLSAPQRARLDVASAAYGSVAGAAENLVPGGC